MKRVTFRDSKDFYTHATQLVESVAVAAIHKRGVFFIALSGGATPLPLYERLAHSTTIDWGNTHVFWSDERSVPPGNPQGSYAATRSALLDHVPVPPSQIHRIPGELTPIDGAEAYEIEIRDSLGADGRLDLVLLGMGKDGHTASLFPHHQALSEARRWLLPVHVSAEPPWRITMTLPLIRYARHVAFLIAGPEKVEILRRLDNGEDLPAARVQPTDGKLTWLVSEEPQETNS